MLNRYGYMIFGSAAVVLSTALSAWAFTIDEQQKSVLSQITVARQTKQITAKQYTELNNAMKEFSKLKRSLKEAHSDVLSAEDDKTLNKSLNDVVQKFEVMLKSGPGGPINAKKRNDR